MSDRPSSRVLAPPGGASQISFGDYGAPTQAPSQRTQVPYLILDSSIEGPEICADDNPPHLTPPYPTPSYTMSHNTNHPTLPHPLLHLKMTNPSEKFDESPMQSTPKPTGVPYGTADEVNEAPLSDFQLRAQHAFESPADEVCPLQLIPPRCSPVSALLARDRFP